jgi:hypothetical protein
MPRNFVQVATGGNDLSRYPPMTGFMVSTLAGLVLWGVVALIVSALT